MLLGVSKFEEPGGAGKGDQRSTAARVTRRGRRERKGSDWRAKDECAASFELMVVGRRGAACEPVTISVHFELAHPTKA